MEFNFTIDGVERRVAVEKKGDGYAFVIGDTAYVVSASPLSNGTFAFFVNDRSNVAVTSRGERGINIGLGGETYILENDEEDEIRGAGHVGGDGNGSVESPMPGNIVAVNVSEGDAVTAGQAVVVIESMKMQNEITASIDGTVKKVNCSVGEQVGLGDLLVEIEPAEEES
jgi:3-methylcrotonyl-CoA carboxylase alpha subunit